MARAAKKPKTKTSRRKAGKQQALRMLAEVPLFEGLSQRELRLVLGSATEVEHPAGEDIVREGTRGIGFHLITDGKAKVKRGSRSLATLGPGDHFGEISLIDKGPRSATVQAHTDVRTLSIASWSFQPLLDRNPTIMRKLMVELCRRLREANRPLD